MSAGKERLRPPVGSAAIDNGQVVTSKDTVIATALDGLKDAQAAVARSLEAVIFEAARRAKVQAEVAALSDTQAFLAQYREARAIETAQRVEFARWLESRPPAGGLR